MKRGYYRYVLAWAEVIPPVLKFNCVAAEEWAVFYMERFKNKTIELKTQAEAGAYLELLHKEDCRCAFVWDKARRSIISIVKFL